MKAHFLQHVPFEGLGSIEPWLNDNGFEVSGTKFYENASLPDLNGIDLVIIMGGPMSVNDEAELEWLKAEKAFIKTAIEQGKAVIGICLGAQLIANALGSKVYQGAQKEIGWFPLIKESSNNKDIFQFPEEVDVFHWHGETFDLPEGAVRLASSIACKNQAFQLGGNVIGLQFHLETTPESAVAMLNNCADELVDGPYIQDAQQIADAPSRNYDKINRLMADILDYITLEQR